MENVKERKRKNYTQDIIRQVKEGEQKAQFQLYKYYFQSMYKTSLDIVKDEGKAEDLLNEAFLKAFDKIDSYDTQDNFDNWLKNIIVFQSKHKLEEPEVSNTTLKYPKETRKNKSLLRTFNQSLDRGKKWIRKIMRSFNFIKPNIYLNH